MRGARATNISLRQPFFQSFVLAMLSSSALTWRRSLRRWIKGLFASSTDRARAAQRSLPGVCIRSHCLLQIPWRWQHRQGGSAAATDCGTKIGGQGHQRVAAGAGRRERKGGGRPSRQAARPRPSRAAAMPASRRAGTASCPFPSGSPAAHSSSARRRCALERSGRAARAAAGAGNRRVCEHSCLCTPTAKPSTSLRSSQSTLCPIPRGACTRPRSWPASREAQRGRGAPLAAPGSRRACIAAGRRTLDTETAH